MAKKLLFLSIFAFVAFAFVNNSIADVLINDARVNRDSNGGLTSGVIESGASDFDNFNNYELVVCGVESDGAPNPFNAPSPGTWDELDNGTCGDLADCQLGIWGRFTDNPDSEEITCSWANSSSVFLAGSYRYSNVDGINPIIDMACTELEGSDLVLRSVSSEPGAQLVTVQIIEVPGNMGTETVLSGPTFAGFAASEVVGGEEVLAILSNSTLDVDGVGFPGLVTPVSDNAARLCVLSLRMATRSVPTMSEWGLISFAAFAGIAGVWYLRRRQATA